MTTHLVDYLVVVVRRVLAVRRAQCRLYLEHGDGRHSAAEGSMHLTSPTLTREPGVDLGRGRD